MTVEVLPGDGPGAGPPGSGASDRSPRPLEIALLASVFVVAACGLVYELAAGALGIIETSSAEMDAFVREAGAMRAPTTRPFGSRIGS